MNKSQISKKNYKLPSHLQFDTVSPATKLLEKRRKMYEVFKLILEFLIFIIQKLNEKLY